MENKFKLTIENLQIIPAGTLFSSGTGTYPEIIQCPIRWVAVRGRVADWVIYYAPLRFNETWISKSGDKLYNDTIIKRLVPCTNEAFKKYRK